MTDLTREGSVPKEHLTKTKGMKKLRGSVRRIDTPPFKRRPLKLSRKRVSPLTRKA